MSCHESPEVPFERKWRDDFVFLGHLKLGSVQEQQGYFFGRDFSFEDPYKVSHEMLRESLCSLHVPHINILKSISESLDFLFLIVFWEPHN